MMRPRVTAIVPIVRPILLVGLLYSIVFSFTDFSSVWLLTQGGPYNTTHVFGTYAYNIGINAGDLGMGAAITLFIFPFLALIVILLLRPWAWRRRGPWAYGTGSAEGVLAERYARGEVTEEEYRARLEVLRRDR